MTKASTDINKTVIRNTVVVTVGSWLSKLLFLAFNIVVVRWLGEVGLGQYATVIAFVGLFGIVFNFGMSQRMERSIAQDPDQAAPLFWNLVALRLVLAFAGVWVITGLAIVAGYDRRLIAGVFIYALTYVLSAVQVPLTGVLRAHERFDAATAALLASRVVSAAVGIVLLWVGAGLFALLLGGFVAVPIQIWLSTRAVRAAGINLAVSRVVPRTWPAMVRTGLPFGLLVMGLSFNANVITVVLGAFSDVATVGWYSASYRLVFHLVGILGGFLTAMMPSLTRMYARDPERAIRWASETFNWLVLIVMPVAAGLSLLAPRTVLLLYGDDYAPAGPILRLLSWDIALMLAMGYFANVCVAGGLERSAARIYVGGMMANVVLAVALISAFDTTGAAVVNIIVDGGGALTFAVVLHRLGWIHFNPRRLGRTVAAASLMSGIVWICLPLPIVLVVLAGAATYAVLVLALGLVEWRAVTTTVKRRFSAPTGTSV